MQKQKPKTKQYVRLRMKERANGVQSLYLDYYRDGKRKYEFLEGFKLLPEVGDAHAVKMAKAHNESVWAQAEAIRAERNNQVIAEASLDGVGGNKYAKLPIAELCELFAEHKRNNGISENRLSTIDLASKKLLEFRPKAILRDVDKKFVKDFVQYLRKFRNKNGKGLSQSSVTLYFSVLTGMLNFAVRQEWISVNPTTQLESDERPHKGDSEREFLTAEEVTKLMHTPCKREEVKNAFLFSCFCGLRFSDIKKLTWGEIHEEGSQVTVRYQVQKTRRRHSMPLSEEALTYIGNRDGAKAEDLVFDLPTWLSTTEETIQKWAADAGITKHVTFHVARHTFATLGLTSGINIAVISSLLAHSDISTTQIYAKVIDAKKTEAVNAIGALFHRQG